MANHNNGNIATDSKDCFKTSVRPSLNTADLFHFFGKENRTILASESESSHSGVSSSSSSSTTDDAAENEPEGLVRSGIGRTMSINDNPMHD